MAFSTVKISKISKMMTKPRVLLLGMVLLSMACAISANPLPDDSETATRFNDSVNSATNSAKGFINRLKNTFTGKANSENEGLTPIELAGVIAAAVILLLILPCCICYCLCECVKELICCICCCGCFRD